MFDLSRFRTLRRGRAASLPALTATIVLAALGVAQAAVPSRAPAVGIGSTAPKTQPSSRWILSHLSEHRAAAPFTAASRMAGGSPAYALNGPWQLAVAPNGDLYVPNLYSNQVLVYGSNLAQKTNGTITTGLTNPTSVAFDAVGEVYVANMEGGASGSVTVYSPNHMYLPNRTIVTGISYPASIAIDGLNDLYVDNGFRSVAIYGNLQFALGNIPFSDGIADINSIAQHGQFIASALAGPQGFVLNFLTVNQIRDIGASAAGDLAYYRANNPRGVAYDANNNVYYVTDDDTAVIVNTTAGTQSVVPLKFDPFSIAVDSNNNHIFICDHAGNAIAVYTLAGKYITTLH